MRAGVDRRRNTDDARADWATVDGEKAEQAKNIFRIAFLEKQVEGAKSPDDLCSTCGASPSPPPVR